MTIEDNDIYDGYRGITVENVITDFLIKDNDLFRSFPIVVGYAVGILVRNAKLNEVEGVIKGNELELGDALVHTGIHVISANHILIQGNDVSFIDGNEHQTRGIILVSSGNSDIRYNTIQGEAEHIALSNHGIEAFLSAGNLTFCNSMENFYIDFLVNGPNNFSDIISNTFKESDYAFAIQTPSMIGVQDHTGNKWLENPYDPFGGFMFGANALATAPFALFLVDENENSDFMPDPIGPMEVDNGNWFVDESTIGATKTCAINIALPLLNPDTLQKLVRTELEFEDFNDQMAWFLKADVIDALLNYPSLHSNSVLDSLYEAEENTALGKLVTWQDLLTSRFGVQRSEKKNCQDTMNWLSDDIVYIDSILTLSPNDSASWLALRALKVDTLTAQMSIWVAFLDEEYSESMTAYSEIQDDLEVLTTTNDLEAYLKEVLLFKADYLLGNSFSSSDSTDLSDLAVLCPWEGGRAISVAQELYSTIDNNMSHPILDNCPSPSPFIGNFPGNSYGLDVGVNLFPNPASEVVTINSDEVINEVFVTDINLKQVYSFKPEGNSLTFDISKLPPGMYLTTIRTETATSTIEFTVTRIK